MIATLDGPRLRLRPLAPEDQALYRRLFADPVVMQHVAAAQDEATAARGFRQALAMNAALPAQRRFWVIAERNGGEAHGLIGLTLDESGGAEVGVVLPEARQGRGLATEAIATLANHAFGALGLHRLHTRHLDGHALAAGLMQSLGFENTARGPAPETWCWQLTPERWASHPRRQAKPDPLT